MGKERMPSEIITDFLDFLQESKDLYNHAKSKCEEFDSSERHIYWDHKFEFAKDRNERNRLSTAYQRERKERRRFKDVCDKYSVLVKFIESDNNKGTLKRLKGMVAPQKHQEEYLTSDRVYKGGGQE